MDINYPDSLQLHFNISNNLHPLAERMIEDQMSDIGIFENCNIVTQTDGMNQWLTLKIVENKGISAHVSFIQPADLIMSIHKTLVDKYTSKISRSNIDWLIYKVLSDKEFQNKYPLQAAYFIEDGQADDVKKWELAATVADLFDQYQIYRHTVIRSWRAHHTSAAEKKYDWQYYIWNKIIDTAGAQFPDMTQMHAEILQALQNTDKIDLLKQTFKSIAFFGISILTPFHYQLIYEIAKHIPCHFYLLNPAPEIFWEQDSSLKEILKYNKGDYTIQGNTLLTQWGKVLQHTFKILNQDDAMLNQHELISIETPSTSHLLGKIQVDIFNNATQTQALTKDDIEDGSIYISAHYSILSEVQGLYNHLLHTISIEKIPNITERDVLIITTDIQQYAPFIKAVFDNAPFQFQYSIADESMADQEPIFSAFKELLQLSPYDLTVEQVLNLLDYKPLREKFSIIDPIWIREMVQQANIRYGISNNIDDDTYLVSWKHGIKKMLLGICFEHKTIYEFKGETIVTTEVPDSQSSMDQIVHLYQFIETLTQHLQARQHPKTLSEWQVFIEHTLNQFFHLGDEQTEETFMTLLKSIQQFHDVQTYLEDIQIPFDVIRHRLDISLQQHQSNQQFLSKGITFCAPLHFRSIPFKYIGFLGLNQDKFPRKEQHEDWNLIKNTKQVGDRNKKENDKHLFLESLLAAKDVLYLSYIGKSIYDNATQAASIIIDELIDYIQEGITDDTNVRNMLIKQYPLQNYSKHYNHPKSPFIPNYLIKEANPFPIPFKTPKLESPPLDSSTLEIKDLLLFSTDSIQYFYKKFANLYLSVQEDNIEETENFQLTKLDKWKIYKSLIEEGKQSDKVDESLKQLYLEGTLPLKNTGLLITKSFKDEISAYWEAVENVSHELHKKSVPIHLSLDNGLQISGKLDDIFDDKLIFFKSGKSTLKYKIESYILSLIGIVAGITKEAYIITNEGIHSSRSESLEEATTQLNIISKLTMNGQSNLYVFNAKFEDKLWEPLDFSQKINSKYQGLTYPDYYFKLLLETEDVSQYYESYKTVMNNIILPAIDYFKAT